MREAFRRTIGVRLFDVQLMGGIVLHEGDIAEMKTGEGKTFVAVQPLYLNGLAGRGRPPRHGQRLPRQARRRVDAARVRAARELGRLDPEPHAVRRAPRGLRLRRHLRDELRVRVRLPPRQHGRLARQTVQRSHAFAIVDEVDSILIDEARTPLIISGEPETAAATYYQFARVVKDLDGAPATRKTAKGLDETELSGADYLYDEKFKTVSPAQSTIEKVERAIGIDNLYDPRNVSLVNHLMQALKARVAVQARRRLRRPGGRGEDRRRVHRPHHGGPALERGPPPGDRGEGGRADPRGERHARDDHAPELLPPLREARRA